jgi:hypothetical protein
MQSVVQRLGAMLEDALKEHASRFRPLVPFLDHQQRNTEQGRKWSA